MDGFLIKCQGSGFLIMYFGDIIMFIVEYTTFCDSNTMLDSSIFILDRTEYFRENCPVSSSSSTVKPMTSNSLFLTSIISLIKSTQNCSPAGTSLYLKSTSFGVNLCTWVALDFNNMHLR